MRLGIVVAMARNGVIGRDGTLPWHLPADLQRFRRLTLGKPIVMGRRTHESIGRVLPGRRNIVLSRDPAFRAAGCEVFASLEQALTALAEVEEVMVVGGAALYAEALPRAARLYLTEVEAEVAGDVRFPPFDRAAWREIERETHAADAANVHAWRFSVLERIQSNGAANRDCT